MTRTLRARAVATSVAAALVLGATACGGADEAPPPEAAPSSSGPSLSDPSAAPTFEVEPVVRPGQVAGRLPRSDRRRVVGAVSGVALRYVEAAFLGGDFPREGGFRAALAGFAPGTARQARRDLGLLTNAAIAPRVDDVTPTALRVDVDLLAARGRASAATARVRLAFRTTGQVEKVVQVRARLMMTKQDGRWKIFAYRLSRGAR